MVACLKITVLGVSKEAAARAGVTGTSIVLDIPSSTGIRLSKSLLELSEANTLSLEGVLAFSLPKNTSTDAAFVEYLTANVIDNRVDKYLCRITVNGNELPFNQIVINGTRGMVWDITIARSKGHWADLATQLRLNELDYGSFTMTKANIIANWALPAYEGDYHDPNTGQSPLYWPLVDYGGWADLTQLKQGEEGRVKSVAIEDFRPFVSLPYLLRAGFCKIGYTLDGVIFDTDWCKRLWVYILNQEYYRAGEVGRSMRIRGKTTRRLRIATFQYDLDYGYLAFNELVEGIDPWTVKTDALGHPVRYYAGITNNSNIALAYRFTVHGEFTNELNEDYTAIFNVAEGIDNKAGTGDIPFTTGEMLTPSEFTVDFAANETKEVYFEAVATLQPNQTAFVDINAGVNMNLEFYAEKGIWVSIEPENRALHKNDTVIVQKAISSEYTLMQAFKGFLHLMRGRFTTDHITKTVTVYPANRASVYGDVLPGFTLTEEAAIDITTKVVKGSANARPVRQDIKRYTELGFKDSSDAYITSLEALTPANGRKLLNGLQFAEGTTQIKNPFFEATIEGVPNEIESGSGGRMPLPYLPRLWDNTNGDRSFVIGPRVLYAYGLHRQVNPSPITPLNEFSSFFLDAVPNGLNTGLVTEFGYATALPTWKLTPAPAQYAGVVYGGGDNSIPDLFTMFYLGITQENRYGTSIDLLLYIKMHEYLDIDFRRLYSFLYNGKQIRVPMQSIRDFSPCENTPTPVTFFVPPAETSCCDLPCGCQFTTCEYYQDFGVYMQQSTLNQLQVTSFIVDGIEYVNNPVGFGVLKIVNIGGLRYVMNMVETLNSIGAPYFTFSASSRKDSIKGVRFFKIKKPACIPFTIVISQSGTPVYRYTQAEQKTTVFNSGSFGPFGYAGTPYSTPMACVTSTEY